MDHTADEREHDEGLCRLRQQIIFTIQPTIKGEPSKAAFHDPALLDHDELAVSPKGVDLGVGQSLTFQKPIPSGIRVWALHNLNVKANIGFDPALPFACVATICTEMQLELRLLCSQL